jgi:hypothetical protein
LQAAAIPAPKLRAFTESSSTDDWSLKRVQDGLGELRDVSATAERLRAQANKRLIRTPDASTGRTCPLPDTCQMLMHLRQAEAVHAQRASSSWRPFEGGPQEETASRAAPAGTNRARRSCDINAASG